LIFVSSPIQAFVSSSRTFTVTEPPMPTEEPMLAPAAMVTRSSNEVAVTARPLAASVVRSPLPSR
jgi:hypothetical protein